MTDEQKELMRIAAQRVIDAYAAGRRITPEALAWAGHWAKRKPLGRPLSDGVPAADRGGNGEVAATDPRLVHLGAF